MLPPLNQHVNTKLGELFCPDSTARSHPTPNELVRMSSCPLHWDMGRRRRNGCFFSLRVEDFVFHQQDDDIKTLLILSKNVWFEMDNARLSRPPTSTLAYELKMEASSFAGRDWAQRPAEEDRTCVLTQQFVCIPEGNFNPWERSKSGWGTMSSGWRVAVPHQWSTGPAGIVAAPGHVGGTLKLMYPG